MATFGILLGIRIGQENRDLDLFSVEPKATVNKDFGVDEVLGFIEEKYVDSTDTRLLEEMAIRHIVDSLDPHSYFLDPQEVALYDTRMQGHLVGIGIEFLKVLDTIVVTGVLENSPASETGLQRGDQIITMNSEVLAGVNLSVQTIINKLQGKRKSRVRLGVLKANDGSFEDIALRRASMPLRPITLIHSIGDSTVFVSLDQFNARTSRDFLDGLEPYVEADKLKHLILDLRSNPGGYLPEAVKLLNQFFKKKGKLLVYTEGSKSRKTEYKTAGRAYLNIEKLVVLVNEESASASEIVAGAVQDWDRGVIIGRRTFGKGLVQEQYDLGETGKLRLTVARYYTPSGRLIQKEITNNEDYSHDLYNRSNNGEWTSSKDVPLPDSTIFYTEAGRKVYGGRGIVPDIFIPVDSFVMSPYFFKVIEHIEHQALQIYRKSYMSEDVRNKMSRAIEENETLEIDLLETIIKAVGEECRSYVMQRGDEIHDRFLERYIRYQGGKEKQLIYKLNRDPYFKAAMDVIRSTNMNNLLLAEH